MATTDLPIAEEISDAPPPAPASGAHLSYAGASRVVTAGNAATVELFGNLDRPPVRFDATVTNPLRFREALSALYGVIGSDYRYAPKDRTQYIAYLRLKRDAAPLGVWNAQQAYFAWVLRNDPNALAILDPVVSIHPDQITFEVFGKDESTYACLAFGNDGFTGAGAVAHGTTNIDFSDALYASVQQIRGYRTTRLALGPAAGGAAPDAGKGGVLEKKIQVPDSWLRGFLQVQSAATLPFDHVQLSPMDLYNVLRHLRMNGDRKGKKRGLRFELVPGQQPRIVAEPWETVFTTTADVFRGKAARLVRVWGRRRLMTVKRLLPFVQSVDVYLLGSGLPSFWVFRCSDITLTLGMTGFTSANWSSALGFDLLLPRGTQDGEPTKKVVAHLAQHWKATHKELGTATGVKGAALVEAVQVGCQNGELMYDIANGVYRHRPLTAQPLDLARLQFRNAREKLAHDLLTRSRAVRITGENRIAGVGLELTGTVAVAEDKRDYRPQMVLADEGQVRKVTCTCAPFRKHGIKAGPCVHLIALRLAFAEKESKKAKSDDAVKFETRAFAKRDGEIERVVQISLERDKVKYRWGLSGQPMRLQTMRFNTEDAARRAYFAKLADLDTKGYLDAIAE